MASRGALALLCLAAVFAAHAAWCAATTSGTFDETTYLRYGRGLHEAFDVEPLAAWGIAPLPVWLFAAPPIAKAATYRGAVAAARAAAIVVFGLPLLAIVFATMRRRVGTRTAVAGAAIVALSPDIVAHASLATTDVCFVTAALAALAALIRHLERPSRHSLAAVCVTLSVALAAKYAALVLFPIVFIAHLLSPSDTRPLGPRLLAAAATTVALFAVAVLAVWALHGFALVPYGLPPFEQVRMPASIVGISRQLHHQSLGEPAFFLGERSRFGWWSYMPVAFAMKSTPAELVVGIAAAAAVALGRPGDVAGRVFRIAFVAFWASAIANRVDLGIRYALVLVPLAVYLAAERGVVAWPLVVLQFASAAAIAPHDLSYFNLFSGGPAAGYTKLADSNVDWGQDLPALRQTLGAVGARRPLLAYFGTAPPEAYGVYADRWPPGRPQDAERYDWLAISATYLDGLFVPGDPFARIRPLPPDARAAFSILLYRTSRPEVRAAIEAAGREVLQ